MGLLMSTANPVEVLSLVKDYGFSVVMCGVVMWYVKYLTDKFMSQIEAERSAHKEEVDGLKEALNSITLVIQKLLDKDGE